MVVATVIHSLGLNLEFSISLNLAMESIIKVEIDEFQEEEVDISLLGVDDDFSYEKDPLDLDEGEIKEEKESQDGTTSQLNYLDINGDNLKEEELMIKEEKIYECDASCNQDMTVSIPCKDPISNEVDLSNSLESSCNWNHLYDKSHIALFCDTELSETINRNSSSGVVNTHFSSSTYLHNFSAKSAVSDRSSYLSHSNNVINFNLGVIDKVKRKRELSERNILVVHKKKEKETYLCDFCGKSYNKWCDLKMHIRSHTGERPFACNVCGKAYYHLGDLKKHKRVHTGEKPFACDVCEKSYYRSDHLIKHKRTHTGEKPYVCDICKIAFRDTGHLKKHKRLHTGEKPYVCDVCQKSFHRSDVFRVHKFKHTKDKPFVCDICNKSFPHNCRLEKHKRIHSKNVPSG